MGDPGIAGPVVDRQTGWPGQAASVAPRQAHPPAAALGSRRVSERVVELDSSFRWDPARRRKCWSPRTTGQSWPSTRTPTTTISGQWSSRGRASARPQLEPNDEARHGHRLAGAGLLQILWVGLVENSTLVAELEAQNAVHPRHRSSDYTNLRHFVLPLKENTVESLQRTCRRPALTVPRCVRPPSVSG